MNRHQRSDETSAKARPTERGASLVEYILLLSLILLVALAGVSAFGTTIGDNVDDSASRVVAASGGSFGG
ncbi:MAG: Flp pilus assembly pilin Flp [Candidatus Aldehydirespiratoraceae bacterium]|jgi:Flp pilus assembly pilin Flp